jgi:ribonuclease G
VSIDINTGRFLGYDNLEETVFKTNCEAVAQIARQIRLRNLAGIIVIDFIDMIDEDHKQIVVEKLKVAFKRDRIKNNILEITELGLVQMTRQRHRPSLSTKMKEPCPYCSGAGKVLSREYMGSKLFREIQDACRKVRTEVLLVSAHPRVARLLLETRRKSLNELEERFNKKIYIRGEAGYHQEQFKVVGEGQNLTKESACDSF